MSKMKFKDAPVGARFKYPGGNNAWVKINSYPEGPLNDGRGLICQWNGNVEGYQSFCSFVDEENGIDFNTEVELIEDDLWIPADLETPKLIENENYSENVLAICNGVLAVMCYCYIPGDDGGFVWANCNGDINGDAEFDDDYNVTYWQYLPKSK